MPPKFTFPSRNIGSAPSMVTIFPGIARHIPFIPFSMLAPPRFSRRRDYLSQRDAAVVRRNALMPVRAEAFCQQPHDSAFGEVFVLKTSAGQNYFFFTHAPRDGDDAFNHSVVKLRRDFFGRDASTDVVDGAE